MIVVEKKLFLARYTFFSFSTGEIAMRKEQLTSQHILKIKDDVGTCWRDLGIALGIDTAKVHNIEHDCRDLREMAHRVLDIWIEKKGSDATVGRLACALIKIGHKRIADKLLGV